MLKVAGFGKYKLGPRESHALEDLSKKLKTAPQFKDLRDWMQNPSSPAPRDTIQAPWAVASAQTPLCLTYQRTRPIRPTSHLHI
jgi:hypothetical protein